ncbi:hypothetical protein IGI37_000503 [Enterococcus sp. AZ194]|uniref:HutD/Ves family protein n=1 Tax=Enterococcus sp. AZ194 TaxID=2774629 RepID=UPI003F26ACE0
MTFKILTETDYQISQWSGGETKEFYIYPETSAYAKKNFDYRISSATIAVEESLFTSLPNYSRCLMVLENEVKLIHELPNEKIVCRLAPFQKTYFSGAVTTRSIGKCKDFNVMYTSDYTVSVAVINEGDVELAAENSYFFYLLNECVCSQLNNKEVVLKAGMAYVLSNESGKMKFIASTEDGIIGILCCFKRK